MGPPLNDSPNPYSDFNKRLLTRKIASCPKIKIGVVDVRDVALAHY